MRRAFFAVLVALGLMSSFMYSTAVAASPAPTYSATFTVSPACEFDAAASWKSAKVDTVYAIWFQDGTAFENHLFTMTAPWAAGNSGTMKGRTANFHTGALPTTTESHTFYLLVQFYANGAHQHEIWLQQSATCSRP